MQPIVVRRIGWWLVLVIAAATAGWAGTLTGKIVLPTTTLAVQNGTLTFTLNQAAAVPGSFLVVPQTVTCATSVDGTVVGLPNPTALPEVTANPGSGSLAAGTYFVEITYPGDGGETLSSPERAVVLTAPGSLVVNAPLSLPAGAGSWNVYVGSSSGKEALQGSAAATSNWTQASALTTNGAAPPGSNTTVCSLTFNDATVPAPTYYQVNLTDAEQNQVAGFPQNWYLSGGTVNVSQLVPLSSNPAVLFPTPVLSNPATSQPQSIASALDLNNYPIENSSNLGPGMVSGTWTGTLPAATTVIGGWTPNTNVALRRISVFAQTAGSGGTLGLTLSVSDGYNTCTFIGLLAGAAINASGVASGACSFNAGIALTVSISGDDHTTRPGNVSWNLEMTGR